MQHAFVIFIFLAIMAAIAFPMKWILRYWLAGSDIESFQDYKVEQSISTQIERSLLGLMGMFWN